MNRNSNPKSAHRHASGAVPKIVVTVAPVAHVETFLPSSCKNPTSPEEIAEEARRCESAGASVIHLHVRDVKGAITSDLSLFKHTLDLVTSQTRLVINGSTGGASDLSREERCVALNDPRVEVASLNMGSSNFGDGVYINTLEDIRYWADRIGNARVVPELEVFASSMVHSVYDLYEEGTLVRPLHFNVCLGFPGAAPATSAELVHFARTIREEDSWGFLHEGMTSLRTVAAALGLGASALRVGFEDGGYVKPNVEARCNADLVDNLVTLIRAAGCEPATVDEARAMLESP